MSRPRAAPARADLSQRTEEQAQLVIPDNPPMAQGKRISADIDPHALQAIKDIGAAAKQARLNAGEGQAAAAARLGVHVQTNARIGSGEPGVAIGHALGLLALYGVVVTLQAPDSAQS